MMQCRKCQAPARFTPVRAESLRRFREFMVLAAVLAGLGVVFDLGGITLWPLFFYGVAGFVLLQAVLKWSESRWVLCDTCGHGYTHWGPTRDQEN